MSIRTVLLYLDHESNAERLTALAADIANRASETDAPGVSPPLLVGAHVTPMMAFGGGVADAVSGGASMRYAEAQRAITERIRVRFTEAAQAGGAEWDWDALAGVSRGEGAALCERARSADLVVMPQPPEGGATHFIGVAIRELVTGSGRPVLVVPRVGEFERVGKRALVGWSPTREATRAVHDALALLRPGVRATLLRVEHGHRRHAESERSAREMAAWLERHGVATDVVHRANTVVAIGDWLLNESFERGADLLVIGGYGHSRLYDAVLGATTRHLLAHMTLPVLFAH